ncbi:MAG: rhodanese-like domain-containing protein [Gammaproteobacteria bacterium]
MMDSLVSAEWLSRHLDDPDLVVLDCTVNQVPEEGGGFHNVSGRPEFEKGHIPAAGFADLKGDLCDANSPIEFAVPTPEQFCVAMGALGVGDDSRVVLYDTSYSAWAARVWWMLRWVGFDRAAILNGGLKVWTAEGRPLSTEPASRPARHLTPAPRPELIANRDEVLADLLDESGRFRPDDELAALHGSDRNARTITYCGGGIMASANAFIMTRLGFTNVAVYTASLQEWAADPANPMVVERDSGG